MSSATYANRMATGLCVDCGGAKENTSACRCIACQQKQRISKAKYKRGLWVRTDREELAADTSPRCRCGLRLPCNSCVPTAADMAAMRVSQ